MSSSLVMRYLLLILCLCTPLAVQAQVQVSRIARGKDTVTMDWQGGYGPYLLETSSDLRNWSDLGEPGTSTTRTLPAFGDRGFYRVADLNPGNLYGDLFGLIQTEQGEFGALLGRHRLKTRLWLYKTKGPPHTSVSYTPADYWRKLFLNYQHHEDGRVRTWSGPLEQLGAVSTPSSQRLTLSWSTGGGTNLRTYELTLDFPYPVNTSRSTPPFPSDPTYALKCSHAARQPELDAWTMSLQSTTVDTVNLVQMDPANSSHSWSPRNYRVSKNGVQINLHFLEGLPLYQGRPPWILKTLLLDRWLSPTTATGGSLPAFTTDSYFSRTLLPGHHNFVEVVLIEPALDPAISEATRRALTQANIRYLYTLEDIAIGMNPDDIRYFGYDNTIRDP